MLKDPFMSCVGDKSGKEDNYMILAQFTWKWFLSIKVSNDTESEIVGEK